MLLFNTKANYEAQCIREYHSKWEESDCDGTSFSDMNFIKGEKYRIQKMITVSSNFATEDISSFTEYKIYPDNDYDGIYRFDYMKEEEFKKHFRQGKMLAEGQHLNI